MIYDPTTTAQKTHAEFNAAYQACAKEWQGPQNRIPNRDFVLDQTIKLMSRHPLSIRELVKAIFLACEAMSLSSKSN